MASAARPMRGSSGGLAPKRSAKRTAVVIGLVLLVALIVGEVVGQVVASGPAASRREALSYLAAAAPLVASSNEIGAEVAALRNGRLPPGARIGLMSELARLDSEAASELRSLDLLGIGPPTALLEGLLHATLADRQQAVVQFQRGIERAIGSQSSSPDPASAGLVLVEAGVLMSRADQEYSRARSLAGGMGPGRSTRRTGSGEPAPLLPISRWVSSRSLWAVGPATLWAETLRRSPGLCAVVGLSVLTLSVRPAPVRLEGVPATTSTTTTSTTTTSTTTTSTTTTSTTTTTTPAGVPTSSSRGGTKTSSSTSSSSTSSSTTTTFPRPPPTLQLPPPGSVSVLPPTGTIVVEVAVGDTGNIADQRVTLSATLTGSSPGRSRSAGPEVTDVTRRRALGTLGPGGSRYASLPAVTVHLGGSYTLVVTVSAAGVPSKSDQVRLKVARS